MVKAKSQFKRRSTANNVEIMIPVPNDADSPKFKTTIGENVSKPKAQSKASPGLGHVMTVHWELKTALYCILYSPGQCKYVPEEGAVCWTIKSFPGGKEYLMKVTLIQSARILQSLFTNTQTFKLHVT